MVRFLARTRDWMITSPSPAGRVVSVTLPLRLSISPTTVMSGHGYTLPSAVAPATKSLFTTMKGSDTLTLGRGSLNSTGPGSNSQKLLLKRPETSRWISSRVGTQPERMVSLTILSPKAISRRSPPSVRICRVRRRRFQSFSGGVNVPAGMADWILSICSTDRHGVPKKA